MLRLHYNHFSCLLWRSLERQLIDQEALTIQDYFPSESEVVCIVKQVQEIKVCYCHIKFIYTKTLKVRSNFFMIHL